LSVPAPSPHNVSSGTKNSKMPPSEPITGGSCLSVGSSPTSRSSSELHKQRRATFPTFSDQEMSLMDGSGTSSGGPPVHDPFHFDQTSRPLSSSEPPALTVLASPAPQQHNNRSPETETLLKPIALAPTHIEYKKYRRTYFQYAVQFFIHVQLVDHHLLKPR
jgi:hypothetical protein